jgi:hypothetical protein
VAQATPHPTRNLELTRFVRALKLAAAPIVRVVGLADRRSARNLELTRFVRAVKLAAARFVRVVELADRRPARKQERELARFTRNLTRFVRVVGLADARSARKLVFARPELVVAAGEVTRCSSWLSCVWPGAQTCAPRSPPTARSVLLGGIGERSRRRSRTGC